MSTLTEVVVHVHVYMCEGNMCPALSRPWTTARTTGVRLPQSPSVSFIGRTCDFGLEHTIGSAIYLPHDGKPTSTRLSPSRVCEVVKLSSAPQHPPSRPSSPAKATDKGSLSFGKGRDNEPSFARSGRGKQASFVRRAKSWLARKAGLEGKVLNTKLAC